MSTSFFNNRPFRKTLKVVDNWSPVGFFFWRKYSFQLLAELSLLILVLFQHLIWLMWNLLLEKRYLALRSKQMCNHLFVLKCCFERCFEHNFNVVWWYLFCCKNLFKMLNLFLITFSLVWSIDQGVCISFIANLVSNILWIKDIEIVSGGSFCSSSNLLDWLQCCFQLSCFYYV
jgi:hypothetical protein